MAGQRIRTLPGSSAILAGRGPVDEDTGEISQRLQIWYANAETTWGEREHSHRDADECFVVLRGTLVVEVEGVEHTVGPRQWCRFAPGVFHRIVRAVPPVEALVIRAPGHDDKTYRESQATSELDA